MVSQIPQFPGERENVMWQLLKLGLIVCVLG